MHKRQAPGRSPCAGRKQDMRARIGCGGRSHPSIRFCQAASRTALRQPNLNPSEGYSTNKKIREPWNLNDGPWPHVRRGSRQRRKSWASGTRRRVEQTPGSPPPGARAEIKARAHSGNSCAGLGGRLATNRVGPLQPSTHGIATADNSEPQLRASSSPSRPCNLRAPVHSSPTSQRRNPPWMQRLNKSDEDSGTDAASPIRHPWL